MDRSDKAGPPIIGIVGGIGSGKSAVARVFESLGGAVIDSDRLGHEQLADPEVVARLRAWWGPRVCDDSGQVDRSVIAGIVFDDPAALARLQDLLYPRIARRRDEMIARYRADPGVRAIVLDTPKLFEAGLERICEAVVFVDAPRAMRLERVRRSRGWSEAELDRREKLLSPLDKKRERADYTVVNDSGVDELRPSIERILSTIIESR